MERKGIISDEDVRRVREASDLVALIGERTPVKQRGKDFWCCCPLHNEKTPSFKIDPAMQLWHCFGCGEGGDVFAYVMKTDDMSFPEAVRLLADRAHIDIAEAPGQRGASQGQKARLKACCKEASDFYHAQLMRARSPEADAARAYLSGRNLGGGVPNTWNLGFAPGGGQLVRHLSAKGFSPAEMIAANVAVSRRNGQVADRFYNRIMFPINDFAGDCIAFGGRIMGDGQPKYLNSQETPVFHKSQVLYGLDRAKVAMAATGIAVVVEGYTDVIALHEAGLENAVATLGTALTLQHIRVLSRHAKNAIVYLFDGDAAGQRAADRALGFVDENMTPEAGRLKVELCAVTLPDNLDPADFVANRGIEELRHLIDDAQPLLQYGIDRRLAAHDLSRAEGRSAAFADALSVLAPIKGSLLAKDYAVQIASRTRMREQEAFDQLARLKAPSVPAADSSSPTFDFAGGSADGGAARYQTAGLGNTATGTPQENLAAPISSGSELSRYEDNRRRLEREFLCVCAQNPAVALSHSDTLAQVQWHDAALEQLAGCLLNALVESPQFKGGELVTMLIANNPQAASILTSGLSGQSAQADELAAFLSEELALGDLEDSIATLKAEMNASQALSFEEYEQMFEIVVSMQKDLTRRRAANRPPAMK